jgi:ABC-2 type transport system ATP-binding protein
MSTPMAAVQTSGLGKRYGRSWGLLDCSFRLPQGRVAALVGPNGAGKSTLLRMLAGISTPSAGELSVLGRSPRTQRAEILARIGYLDQTRPLYQGFRVSEMLRFGRELNPRWDEARARHHLDELAIGLQSRIGSLSGGQQAQVALTMCLAKRPELLLLDEPVAALDPLARDDVMHILLQAVVDDGATVLISSHAIADLATVCDYVIILSASRVQLADELDNVLASHRMLVGPTGTTPVLPGSAAVVSSVTTGRQHTMIVRTGSPVTDPGWQVVEPTLEEIVIAYLRARSRPAARADRPGRGHGRGGHGRGGPGRAWPGRAGHGHDEPEVRIR